MQKILIALMAVILLVLPGCSFSGQNSSLKNSTNAAQKETETQHETDMQNSELPLSGKIICIDAGHGVNSYNKQEPIAPNSSQTKIAFATGTHGKNQTEEELNLSVAKKLEKKLIELGADVHMTRTTHESDMTNVDRAEFANKINADISVKIHADGIENNTVHGASMLVPSNQYINNQELCDISRSAGEIILNEVIKNTGANNRGVVVRSDLTGFNWTKVPIVLLEMGFMTNPKEDADMETDAYQDKIAEGISQGLILFFEEQ